MINGSFTVVMINGKFLFLKRKDNGLLDLPGGGFEVNENDYKSIAMRELDEETGIQIRKENLHLFAILGQRLKKEITEKYRVEKGLIFVHYTMLYSVPEILLSEEHSDFFLFSYDEIISKYEIFSSGPLWQFFTFMTFQETNKFQEGNLFDRRFWQGKEYYVKKS